MEEPKFKPGQVVIVVPLNRNRMIMATSGEFALCKSFATGDDDWYPFSDLRGADNRPMKVLPIT